MKVFWMKHAGLWKIMTDPAKILLTLEPLPDGCWQGQCLGRTTQWMAELNEHAAKLMAEDWFRGLIERLVDSPILPDRHHDNGLPRT